MIGVSRIREMWAHGWIGGQMLLSGTDVLRVRVSGIVERRVRHRGLSRRVLHPWSGSLASQTPNGGTVHRIQSDKPFCGALERRKSLRVRATEGGFLK